MNCTKAIIAVAGYGTRRLPVTKAVEKCMLPILNRPIVDYVVEDCIKAGVTDIYLVVNKGASQVKAFYAEAPELEAFLRAHNKPQLIDSVQPPGGVNFHFVEQDLTDAKYGTTIPFALCSEVIAEGEQVLVAGGDQALYRTDGGSEAADLLQAVEAAGLTAGLIGVPVPAESVSQYGIIDKNPDGTYRQIIEHPSIDEAPSNLNNASFYLFDSELMRYVKDAAQRGPSQEGEYMIVHPINDYVSAGNKMVVHDAKGTYLDCGSVENWLAANSFMASHPDKL